jgi:hypothetical protein
VTWLPRAIGAVTTAYGVTILVRPELLLGPSGLLHGKRAEPEQAMFVRTLGVRDLASGLALLFARGRRATRVAIAVRVASDTGDALVLARALRGKPERDAVVAFAAASAVVGALSAWTTRK